MKDKGITISFLIVNYDSEEHVKRLIEELAIKVRRSYEVIVSNNDPVHTFTTEYSNVIVLENGHNIGFGKAHNRAAQRARGRYLCVINPDIYGITDHIDDIVVSFEGENVGIVAPRICDQYHHVEKWSYGTQDLTPWSVLWNNMRGKKEHRVGRSDSCIPYGMCSLAWVTGALFFMEKSLFEKVGGFDENFFLYYEDVDLCRRVKARGFSIIRNISFTAHHISGASSNDYGRKKKSYYESQHYYFTKHHGLLWSGFIKCVRICLRRT